jgi:hypothetical protein
MNAQSCLRAAAETYSCSRVCKLHTFCLAVFLTQASSAVSARTAPSCCSQAAPQILLPALGELIPTEPPILTSWPLQYSVKNTISWDVTPCRISPTFRKKIWSPSAYRDLVRLALRPWMWRQYVPLKRRWTSRGLRTIIFQYIILFTVIGVRT